MINGADIVKRKPRGNTGLFCALYTSSRVKTVNLYLSQNSDVFDPRYMEYFGLRNTTGKFQYVVRVPKMKCFLLNKIVQGRSFVLCKSFFFFQSYQITWIIGDVFLFFKEIRHIG